MLIDANMSIVVPSLERGEVLLQTIPMLRELTPPAAEIIIVDQTAAYPDSIQRQMADWAAAGIIRWERRLQPSVPAAMNHGLITARCPIVLFLDDDIVPAKNLIQGHLQNYSDASVWAVTGQVLQPGQQPAPVMARPSKSALWRDLDFGFYSNQRQRVHNCMAGNLSVRRDRAIDVGGFDENFVRIAYRFETDFIRRLIRGGGAVVFEPEASIQHLLLGRGGTRVYGHHHQTFRPDHSVGEYYFALRHGRGAERFTFAAYRLFRVLRTRHNVLHPWKIPLRLVAELRGFAWAIRLFRQGPQHLSHPEAV